MIHPQPSIAYQSALPTHPVQQVAKPTPANPGYGRGIDPPEERRVNEQPVPVAEAPETPKSRSKTVSFMPGQAVNLPNKLYRKVEIHSEYPLRVLTGRCHNDYTVQFFCEGEPADIFISDTRRRPIFTTPKGNLVTITITKF